MSSLPPFLPVWVPTRLSIALWKWFHRKESSGDNSAPSILIVRLDGLGDCILTTPLISELRRWSPKARITVATRPIAVDLFAGNPDVDEIYPVRMYRGRSRLLKGILPIFTALYVYWSFLRRRHFDIAISPRYEADLDIATMLCALSFAPVVVGFADDVSSHRPSLNGGYQQLFNRLVPKQPNVHEVVRHLAIADALTGQTRHQHVPVTVVATPEAKASAEVWFSRAGLSKSDHILFVGLPAANLQRRWNPQYFAEAIRQYATPETAVVIACDSENEDAANLIADEIRPLKAIIALNRPLLELRWLFEQGSMYFGNDSGLGHLAAAAGVPAVIVTNHPLTAPRDHVHSPQAFAPWGERVISLQPDHPASPECVNGCVMYQAHCINVVQPAEVVAAARELAVRA